ncbi:hypothetical protein Golax_020389, partial [Gossypium laxum]|nr:hypothetical protein [Gossypium laxum]
MPRSRNKEAAAPSDYYGWRCGEPVEGNRNNVKFFKLEKTLHNSFKNIIVKIEKEERIRLGNHGDYGDSGDNDELTIARHESMKSQVEWEERQCRRARTNQDSVFEIRGGSNFGTQEIRRLFRVYNSEISGRECQWTNLDSPKARLANMDHVLERSKIATEVGKLVRGPSTYEVTGVYLEDEYKEIQEWYYFGLMDKMVDEIGEEFVVLVVTDNEAAIKAGGHMLMQKRRHLYWSTCSTHCLNLILEEIGNRKSVKKALDEAKNITSFIHNHTWTIDYMKKYTKGAELLRPRIIRFATNFIAFESIVRSKQALNEMVTSSAWKRSTYGRKPATLELMEVINSSEFWKKVVDVFKDPRI